MDLSFIPSQIVPQVESLAKSAYQEFLGKLQGAALTPDQEQLVTDALKTEISGHILTIGADQAMKDTWTQRLADAASELENIAVGEAIQLGGIVKTAAAKLMGQALAVVVNAGEAALKGALLAAL